eukprot:CAMPEP_0184707474 /NCGR_PEP_ID=MMETSP0313-20130426/37287_1 /TAXON_ID=2792 /ORGANISM="Porphyridium aerugineum, Strain SAG 1380-2" /LENGTH=1371 /DNA_ID=CAMNT_0027169049 /DNA_START=142 /DNA_END=4257 /DNA_ORIENTATION=+
MDPDSTNQDADSNAPLSQDNQRNIEHPSESTASYHHQQSQTPACKLIGWGSNRQGQLGKQGPNELYTKPTDVIGFGNTEPDYITAYGTRSAVLTVSGAVYCSNDPSTLFKNELGDGSENEAENSIVTRTRNQDAWWLKPLRPPENEAEYMRVLKEIEDLYVQPMEPEERTKAQQAILPYEPFPFQPIKQLAMGADFFLALTECGYVFSWGRNDYGQLGAGKIGKELAGRSKPALVERAEHSRITRIAAGAYHWFALAEDGRVYGCGRNDRGQLGIMKGFDASSPLTESSCSLVEITLICFQPIYDIACGESHSLFLTAFGAVFASGMTGSPTTETTKKTMGGKASRYADLGAETDIPIRVDFGGDPTNIQSYKRENASSLDGAAMRKQEMRSDHVVRIACGANHSLALTLGGTIYAWGEGSKGQLGIGSTATISKPTRIRDTVGDKRQKFVDVAAGKHHTVALTSDGQLVVWGAGNEGQIGDGEVMDKMIPLALPPIRSKKRDLDLTELQSDGAGKRRKSDSLGHIPTTGDPNDQDYDLPSNQNMMDHVIDYDSPTRNDTKAATATTYQGTNITCGAYHTLAIVSDSERLHQVSRNKMSQCLQLAPLPKIFLSGEKQETLMAYRPIGYETVPCTSKDVEAVFINVPNLVLSFGRFHGSTVQLDIDILLTVYENILQNHEHGEALLGNVARDFYNHAQARFDLFLLGEPEQNMEMVLAILATLLNPATCLHAATVAGLATLLTSLPREMKLRFVEEAARTPETIFVTRLIKPMLKGIEAELKAFKKVTETAKSLTKALVMIYASSISQSDAEHPFGKVNRSEFQSAAVSSAIDLKTDYQRWVSSGTPTNNNNASSEIHFNAFSSLLSNKKSVNDVLSVLSYEPQSKFSFCGIAPFMLDEKAKSKLMRAESVELQRDEQFRSMLRPGAFSFRPQSLMSHSFCVLKVRRSHIIQDSINNVAYMAPRDLRKPLRVEFEGEPGVDEGGVRKEFFQLVIEKLFSPDYGMFVYDEDTRLQWFNRNSLEIDDFRLVGLMIGLAIYNNIILDLRFPSMIYARLLESSRMSQSQASSRHGERGDGLFDSDSEDGRAMSRRSRRRGDSAFVSSEPPKDAVATEASGKEPTVAGDMSSHAPIFKEFRDVSCALFMLREVFPDQANSLEKLLEFEPAEDVEDVFCTTFSVDYDFYGERKTDDLIPNGRNVAVTGSNREQFVMLYAEYLLFGSVKDQLSAFEQGFTFVIDGPFLQLLTPSELETLVCGEEELDFKALKEGCKYDGGFSPHSPVVTWFWDMLLGDEHMTLQQKKKLLFFVTGSDRAPVGGLASMRFIIQRAGPDADKLPTSHTCFNVLLLPEYQTKEKLKRYLLVAIENAQGFGLQ